MKICPRCGESKPRTDFSRNKNRGDGLQYQCRACMAEYQKKYLTTEICKAGNRVKVLKYRRKNRDKVKVWNILRTETRAGRIEPGPCADCGSEVKTQGHHEDYDKPLEVIWLCHGCHKIRHTEAA